MTTTAADTMTVAKRLVELVAQGENRKAIEELYADDAIAYEAMEGPNGRELKGKDALLGYNDWFFNTMEVHDASIDGPYPNDDKFVCFMSIDLTAKEGPMAGNRMEMKEAALYTVKDGKITRSDFFYNTEC